MIPGMKRVAVGIALTLTFTSLTACAAKDEAESNDCRVLDYEPHGPLSADVPFDERTCDATTDTQLRRFSQRLDDMANDVAVAYTCGDGWVSKAIGSQGACSHHGGVASVTYRDAQDGTLHTVDANP